MLLYRLNINPQNMAIEKEVPIAGKVVMRLDEASFWYNENYPMLKETSFNLREGQKLTLMGPNGAGKSTLFSVIMGENQLTEGRIIIDKDLKVAIAKQHIPHTKWDITVRDFLEEAFKEKKYEIDKLAEEVFKIVELKVSLDLTLRKLSGGQKGRLLIAQALIQKPDILLLDEPTNNLDKEGIKLLTNFMNDFKGTAIVISHDEKFLNDFSHGILYINTQHHVLEQYVGNYFKALDEIKRRVETEERKNAQLEREIQDNKEKVNFFAHKGGKMRKLAAKLKEEVAEMEDNKVDVRKEDRTIKNFVIPCQEEIGGRVLTFTNVEVLKDGAPVIKKYDQILRKGERLQMIGPNGIGKTTLLERIAKNEFEGVKIEKGIKIGYYRQDFSTLDFKKTGYEELCSIFKRLDDHKVRAVAGAFMLSGKELSTPIGFLSEGQKALLMWAYITLSEPGLLIIDEPTNHVNFRHIPAIANAIKNFEGAIIVVSHVNDFVRQLNISHTLDLGKI